MRFTIHTIRDANCTEIDAAVLAEAATAGEAEKLARSIAHLHYYGVATFDTETDSINFGDCVKSAAEVSVIDDCREALAYKYNDPTEKARLVYDESDLSEIRSADPGLLICVGDRVEGGKGEDHDTGRVERIDSLKMAFVAWDSGVKTPAPICDLRVIG